MDRGSGMVTSRSNKAGIGCLRGPLSRFHLAFAMLQLDNAPPCGGSRGLERFAPAEREGAVAPGTLTPTIPHSVRPVSGWPTRSIPEAMLEAASLFRQHARLNCWVPSQGALAPHAKSGGTAEGSPFSCYRAEIRTRPAGSR